MKKLLRTNILFGTVLLFTACGEGAANDDSNTGDVTSTGQTSASNQSSTGGPMGTSGNGPSGTSGGTSSPTAGATGTSNTGETGPADPTSEPGPSTEGPAGPASSAETTTDVTSDGPVDSTAPSSSNTGGETSAPVGMTSEEPVGMDPLLADAVCSSNMSWMRGENDRMRPGEACIACHTAENEGPRYAIAGTLYPTGHEPDDCNGISGATSGAKVIITDANGQEHELTPNSVGNFFFNGNLPKPYTAKVVSADGERLMFSPQQDGDCNKCHTAEGVSGAPGRVVVPF